MKNRNYFGLFSVIVFLLLALVFVRYSFQVTAENHAHAEAQRSVLVLNKAAEDEDLEEQGVSDVSMVSSSTLNEYVGIAPNLQSAFAAPSSLGVDMTIEEEDDDSFQDAVISCPEHSKCFQQINEDDILSLSDND